MATLSARLQALENRLLAPDLEPLWIGLPADSIERLQAKIDYCKEHNKPGAMVQLFPYWNGTPDEQAVEMITAAGFQAATP
jgi:hypothetical protein